MEVNSLRLLMLVLLTAVLAGPPEIESCGPFLTSAQFSYVATPPPGVFASGQLGILRPKYYRRYLVVAFRYLTGVPLSQEEAAAFNPRRPAVPATTDPPTPVGQWTEARNRVPGVTAIQAIEQYRPLQPPSFESYRNCLDDAFVHAAQTLRERAARWGLNSPLLAEWVRGQDAVFKNCDKGKEMPPALPPGADSLLRADRRYQTAAAEFYTEQYEAAEKDFGAIGRDADSPWQDLGEFMVARTLIREATVGEHAEKLPEAQRALDSIIANPQKAKWRNAARGLREFVTARLDPDRQILALSERLMGSESGPEFTRALTDFTLLWDKRNDAPPRETELTDWIATFQAQNWAHAVERWRARRPSDRPSDAWLVAALSSIPHDDPAVPELLAAAQRVQATPAWGSAVFYGISLQLARGEIEAARKWVDQALTANPSPDVRNEFLAQRMALGRSWDEFLRYGPRMPVALGGDFNDEPIEQSGPRYRRKHLFATDFTVPLNLEAPLERWVDAASNNLLPPDLQADIAQAGWVRAVVLDQIPQAQALAARLATLRLQLRTPLQAWLGEKDPQAAKFQAVLLMLRTPGLQPAIRDKFGRLTAVDRIDDFRDNWWDLSEPGSVPEKAPQFLPGPERTAGQKEWQRLQAEALRAPDYLCRETVAWARAHPDDPRVPEALHLAVRTTRYTNGVRTTTFPKLAFALLHTRYPKSKWAALTPYWY
jgi:tetratricopeptide (TPR) repeat protein